MTERRKRYHGLRPAERIAAGERDEPFFADSLETLRRLEREIVRHLR